MIEKVDAYRYGGKLYDNQREALLAEFRNNILGYRQFIGYDVDDSKVVANKDKLIGILQRL